MAAKFQWAAEGLHDVNFPLRDHTDSHKQHQARIFYTADCSRSPSPIHPFSAYESLYVAFHRRKTRHSPLWHPVGFAEGHKIPTENHGSPQVWEVEAPWNSEVCSATGDEGWLTWVPWVAWGWNSSDCKKAVRSRCSRQEELARYRPCWMLFERFWESQKKRMLRRADSHAMSARQRREDTAAWSV